MWPRKLVVAKAYVDQLERSQGLSTDRIEVLREAIQRAENANLSRIERAKLRAIARTLDKIATETKVAADANRLRALADALRQPVR